eukprot:1160167-Pelagomonas_calceolata.AAC.7
MHGWECTAKKCSYVQLNECNCHGNAAVSMHNEELTPNTIKSGRGFEASNSTRRLSDAAVVDAKTIHLQSLQNLEADQPGMVSACGGGSWDPPLSFDLELGRGDRLALHRPKFNVNIPGLSNWHRL